MRQQSFLESQKINWATTLTGMPDEKSTLAVAEAIRAARGTRTQDWLGTEVATLEGRDEAYGQNTVAGWESGKYALKPRKLFVIERALGVAPGAISRIAGYVPAATKPARTVAEAIAADNDLSSDQKEDLVAQYQGMVARTRARRRSRQARSGR